MSDLELTKACAEAMGLDVREYDGDLWIDFRGVGNEVYRPLHDDAQAMALVKRFGLSVKLSTRLQEANPELEWRVGNNTSPIFYWDADLNHAICQCVSALREAAQKL